MAGLPAVGTFSYGGYTFDGASEIKARIVFIKDDAGRTVVCHENTFDIRSTITADSGTTDSSLMAIRAALSKQGQELKFINRGFGTDIWINRPGGGGLRDMRWGPIPEELSWESVGSSQACEIEWRVKTYIPVCNASGVHRTTGIMAVNYDCSFQIEDGFTTRIITGYLEIAQTRILRSVPDCADLYREFINPEPPAGFKRTADYQVDAAKSRLNFTITDTENRSKNAYPPGVVSIKSEHRSNWTRSNESGAKIQNSISANITLARGIPNTQAWVIFGGIVSQRVIAGALASGKIPFLQSLSVEEDIYSYSSSFQASYWVLGNPQDFLQKSGLWKPLPGNWQQWQKSLASSMFDPRGTAGLVLSPGNDAIVDICGGQPVDVSSVANATGKGNVPISPFQNKKPPIANSYLKYKMQAVTTAQNSSTTQSIMQAPNAATGSVSMLDQQGPNYGPRGGTADIIQKSGRDSYEVTLVGMAVRAAYLIPKPLLQQVGGLPAVEISSAFAQEAVGNYFGVPVFRAAWKIVYKIAASPGTVQMPANIEQGIPAK